MAAQAFLPGHQVAGVGREVSALQNYEIRSPQSSALSPIMLHLLKSSLPYIETEKSINDLASEPKGGFKNEF